MTDTNKTLNEQMEALHNSVTEIASVMAQIYATNKAIDQKAMVIGQALVRQKEATRQIQSNQAEQTDLVVECDNQEKDRQREVLEAVREVAQSLANLEDTEVKKDLLTQSLERLSEEQTAFMEENREFSKSAAEDLAQIRSTLFSMKQIAEQIDVPDQVRIINSKVEEMKKALASYTEKRSKITQAMAKQTQDTLAQIGKIASLMDAQREDVMRIAKISEEYGDKTIEMCQLLTQLLDEVRTVKAQEEKAPTLEDLFGSKELLGEDDFDDASEEELDAEMSEDLDAPAEDTSKETSSGPEDTIKEEDLDEEMAETLEEDTQEEKQPEPENDPKPLFRDMDDDLTFVDENGAKSVRPKKKGFFARLFGGR